MTHRVRRGNRGSQRGQKHAVAKAEKKNRTARFKGSQRKIQSTTCPLSKTIAPRRTIATSRMKVNEQRVEPIVKNPRLKGRPGLQDGVVVSGQRQLHCSIQVIKSKDRNVSRSGWREIGCTARNKVHQPQLPRHSNSLRDASANQTHIDDPLKTKVRKLI